MRSLAKVLAVLAVSAVFVLSAHAAALTSAQISAILSLLSSFGADQSTIANVELALNGIPTPPSTNASCITLSYNLYFGLTDGEVSQLQQFLGLSPTGYFGILTQQAVQNWQASHGIVSSGSPSTTGWGFVGPATRAALGNCAPFQQPQTPTAPPSPSGGAAPDLTVSGNQILASGQRFQVKGLNVDVLAPDPVAVADNFQQDGWYAPYIAAAYQKIDVDPGGTAALLAAAKEWDANTIRIWLVQPDLDPQDGTLTSTKRSAYIAEVQSTVNELTADGFAVIASMTGAQPIDPTASTTRAWQTILPVLAGNHSVMLDLFNEPQDETNWQVWEYGATVTDASGQSVQVVGMQPLLNAIRNAGASNVIIAQTYNQRDVSTSNLLSDPLGQVVYAIHPRIFGFDNALPSTYPGLTVGSAFSTSTDAAMFDQAFGNAAQQVPVVADEWDMLEFTGSTVSCQDIPQLGYFEAAYLQKYTDGVVGYSVDYPGYTITTDRNYDPRGYDISPCSSSANAILTNIGDVGALLYSWYHGVDLWDSTGSPSQIPSITSFSPTSGPVGTSLTITGSGFTTIGNQLWCMTGCSYSPGVIPNATNLSSNGSVITYTVPGSPAGAYTIAVVNPGGTSNSAAFTVTPPTITSLSPTSGPVGTQLTIKGTGFTPNYNNHIWCMTGCSYSPAVIPGATSLPSPNSTTLTYTIPSSPPGTYTIAVVNGQGDKTNAAAFTVTSL